MNLILLASLMSAPCITARPDCEQGVRTVVFELHRVPPPWSILDAPAEWTALAACPPDVVTWCPTTPPPYWIGWQTWSASGALIGSGWRAFP